ncbi:MAG: ATP-binding protein [Bacteroidales bacterium]|nr:ATP-binding protein [Bacteroidales bacterium]
MITRKLEWILQEKLFQGKAIILIGARQVGKTTLLKQLLENQQNVLWLNADDLLVRTFLDDVSVEKYRTLFGNNKMVVVDEAQRIENIGLKSKLIIDNFPDIQLLLTGSSSFDLANKINEPLTGRKWEYTMFPLSFAEMVTSTNLLEEMKNLENRMIFGYYPDVVTHPENSNEILKMLSESYLYKDILEWERIKKPDKLVKLLQALSFQIGSEVSYSELGRTLSIDKVTIEKYIQLLEQMQVIFRLSSFSRNLRNELKNSKKIYFYDNGIRNILINNLSPLALRNDVGALWENFLVSERIKYNHYTKQYSNFYFWRTTLQQEIDLIEEKDGKITAYEFIWNQHRNVKFSKSFLQAYPESDFKVIQKENFFEILI